MKREKLSRLSLFLLGFALLFSFFAMTTFSYVLFLLVLLIISASLLIDAFSLHLLLRKHESIIQLVRGVLLFIIVFLLFIRLFKG